jgi:ElaB/YqjD/DUF883 family membrane-anchored ribosome-binding protein
MAEHDDQRESPSSRRGRDEDWSRDVYPRRSAHVTQEELRSELRDFREAMDTGFNRLTSEIKQSETKWRERTHELSQTAQAQAVSLALQEQRLKNIESAAEAAKQDRRWLWGSVISAAGLISGVVAWLAEFVRHRP